MVVQIIRSPEAKDFIINGIRTFFLKFFDEESLKEFMYIKAYYEANCLGLNIEEMEGGSYMVQDLRSKKIGNDYAWDILMHKYYAMQNFPKEENGVKYRPVIFSSRPIPVLAEKVMVG